MEEMVQREYFTPSGSINRKAVSRAILAIGLILAIFFAIFAFAFFFAFNVRYDVTISVYSENYNGPVKIYIDEREVHSDEIIVGETIEKTFSLRGGRYRFTIYYGHNEINDYEEIEYHEKLSYKI
jgi:hypothetical protein